MESVIRCVDVFGQKIILNTKNHAIADTWAKYIMNIGNMFKTHVEMFFIMKKNGRSLETCVITDFTNMIKSVKVPKIRGTSRLCDFQPPPPPASTRLGWSREGSDRLSICPSATLHRPGRNQTDKKI